MFIFCHIFGPENLLPCLSVHLFSDLFVTSSLSDYQLIYQICNFAIPIPPYLRLDQLTLHLSPSMTPVFHFLTHRHANGLIIASPSQSPLYPHFNPPPLPFSTLFVSASLRPSPYSPLFHPITLPLIILVHCLPFLVHGSDTVFSDLSPLAFPRNYMYIDRPKSMQQI